MIICKQKNHCFSVFLSYIESLRSLQIFLLNHRYQNENKQLVRADIAAPTAPTAVDPHFLDRKDQETHVEGVVQEEIPRSVDAGHIHTRAEDLSAVFHTELVDGVLRHTRDSAEPEQCDYFWRRSEIGD